MARSFAAVAWIRLFLFFACVTLAQAEPATVVQPRPFGYVLGDTLSQRILLASSGREFEPVALPSIERAGLWFARRSAKIERENGKRWLLVDYQLVNAPQALMSVNLPALTLKTQSGAELTVTEWPVSIGPLTPRAVFAKGGLQELRPDHVAPTIPTLTLQRGFEFWTGALALVVLGWLTWWVIGVLRARADQPFARALRVIRRSGAESELAWMALHRAFDRTAGRSVQLSTLSVLFRQAPQLEPQRAAIESFFSASSRRFFGTGEASLEANSLRSLCTALRAIEKRHDR